jgi:hypothetical protein
MRYVLIVLASMFLGGALPAAAQVSFGVSIGINLPVYPQLQPVPGYPVYYAPQVASNYFFYDGLYWVYASDTWYQSSWYNGPWAVVAPMVVPVYILQVPVRYYRAPPPYFAGWRGDAPPRWGDHWGQNWQRQHAGWDHVNQGSMPTAAPLPVYQKQYSGSRYPTTVDQQRAITSKSYNYQPHEAMAEQHVQQDRVANATKSSSKQPPDSERKSPNQEVQTHSQQSRTPNTSEAPPREPTAQQSTEQDRKPPAQEHQEPNGRREEKPEKPDQGRDEPGDGRQDRADNR